MRSKNIFSLPFLFNCFVIFSHSALLFIFIHNFISLPVLLFILTNASCSSNSSLGKIRWESWEALIWTWGHIWTPCIWIQFIDSCLSIQLCYHGGGTMLSENVKVRLSCYLFLSPGPCLSQRTKHPVWGVRKDPAFLLQL